MSKPILKFELGHLSVAVWENAREDRAPQQSVSVTRRYFDKQDSSWKSTSVSINPADVPTVIRLLQATESALLEPTSMPESTAPDF
ncbi:MAG: hypothetical protein KDA88_23580 [Planctomycetaceae bacterium]|nr:hypothetical protein [Planctomycetaceae bacterium]MCB9952140.1 hypothetical protein [Planctomycetaceae bacterium]